MDSLISTMQRENINYSQQITKDRIKELSTSVIKQYLFEKEIKKGTINHDMLMELERRGESIIKYKINR